MCETVRPACLETSSKRGGGGPWPRQHTDTDNDKRVHSGRIRINPHDCNTAKSAPNSLNARLCLPKRSSIFGLEFWIGIRDWNSQSMRMNRLGSRFVSRSRAAHARAAPPGHSGVAKLLLQVPDDRARPLSGARSVHSANEAEEHAAPFEGRRTDHASRAGILRLKKGLSVVW